MTNTERRILEHWMQVICATQGHDLDLDKAYTVFKAAYDTATGHSWPIEKFKQRAANWSFYGDDDGYIALRPQRSGFYKLVAVAGATNSIKHGLKEIQTANLPVWGAVDASLAHASKAFGFIRPPAWLVRRMAPMIGPEVFGNNGPTFNQDGSIQFDTDMGPQTKFFIGSKAYYLMAASKVDSMNVPYANKLTAALKMIVRGRALLPF